LSVRLGIFERIEDRGDVAAVFRQGGGDVEDGSVENLGYGPAGDGAAQRKPFGDRLQLADVPGPVMGDEARNVVGVRGAK
jgi:hypothetical protein